MTRRPIVRILAAVFERDADAEAARKALVGVAGVTLRPSQAASTSNERPTYAFVVARVGLPLRAVVSQIVTRHRGQLVIDLDEARVGDPSGE